MKILGINFVESCYACPESYDAYLEDKNIGYAKLRRGFFYVEYPNIGGTVVFEGHPRGDGRFTDDSDREHFMTHAARALIDEHFGTSTHSLHKLVEAATKVIDEYEGQMEGYTIQSIHDLREALKNVRK
jgi:hypothetical protein